MLLFEVATVSAHLSGGSLVRGFRVHFSEGSLVRRFTCPGVHLSVLFVYYNFLVRVRHSKGPQLPGYDIRFDIRIFRSMYGDGPPLLGVATPTDRHSHGSPLPRVATPRGRYSQSQHHSYRPIFQQNRIARNCILTQNSIARIIFQQISIANIIIFQPNSNVRIYSGRTVSYVRIRTLGVATPGIGGPWDWRPLIATACVVAEIGKITCKIA